ncbi:MAG: S53 family peptidase [Candidatus Binataceae bacterium]
MIRISSGVGAVVAVLSLVVTAAAQGQGFAAASGATPGQATTIAQGLPIAGDHPAEAANFAGGPEISASKILRMQISLALRDRAGLDQLIAAQQDPSSPQYHQWLTPSEFNARFGPTESDLATVTAWLATQGFTLETQSLPQRKVVFSGAAASAESAFAVKIHTDPAGKRYANLDDPIVPKSIAPMVASIRGLSNLVHARPTVELSPDFSAVPNVKLGKVTHFGPNDLYTFYGQTPPTSSANNGAGADCIAVVEDSNFDDGSVDVFNNEFGLEQFTAVRVYADGADPGPTGEDEIEALLDVEYAHAAAPGVPIYAYIGDDLVAQSGNGVLDAAARAVSDNICGAISVSFSFCGVPSAFYASEVDPIAKQAAAQGQTVFASAGDFGAAGYALNKQGTACVAGSLRNVSEVSADPNITAVGGTQFRPRYKNGNDVGSVRESVWKDKTGAGGGGESGVFPKPSYQSGLIPKDSNRDVPDVSLAASPLHPGFLFGYQGAVYCCIGGTSLGSPYWAGIAQLAAQKENSTRVGPLNATLYSIASGAGIRDVTKGGNAFHRVAGFRATKGYDRASGLGTPNIDNLTDAIAAH